MNAVQEGNINVITTLVAISPKVLYSGNRLKLKEVKTSISARLA